MGLWRGYYSSISRGEVYIFALSVAVLLYFFRSKTNKQDQVYKIFRYMCISDILYILHILYIFVYHMRNVIFKKTGWLLGDMKRLNILERKTHIPKHLRETLRLTAQRMTEVYIGALQDINSVFYGSPLRHINILLIA